MSFSNFFCQNVKSIRNSFIIFKTDSITAGSSNLTLSVDPNIQYKRISLKLYFNHPSYPKHTFNNLTNHFLIVCFPVSTIGTATSSAGW